MNSTIIKIEGVEQTNVDRFAPVLEKFLSAYDQKPDEVAFEDWLSTQLLDQLTELSVPEAHSLAKELSEGVDSFQANLRSLNSAIEEGKTKEAWLAAQLLNASHEAGIDAQVLGNHLNQIERVLGK